MNEHSRDPGLYKSALDLPSVSELLEQIRGFKALTLVIARKQRAQVLKLEGDLKQLAKLVDDFYALLGSRNWIFHENLNTEQMTAVVRLSADEAELRLIDFYKDSEQLDFMIRTLCRFPQLLDRMALIERAQKDYEEGRYYATVLVLITIMDGFVNDIETARRRGLHARTEDEMAAWDSVVGHHLGLASAHKTFTKRFSKTSDEEVYELYRNGIMHGMLLNYDNPVVATKAWNRLFAAADWATSREKQEIPPEPKPKWNELFRQIGDNQKTKKALEEWRPRVATEAEAGFTNEPLYLVAVDYLAAWQTSNYGRMAQLLSSLARDDDESDSKTAGMVREQSAGFELSGFGISKLNFEAPAICEIDISLVLGDQTKPARMRWIREGEDGMSVAPNQPGEWRLIFWGPMAMINNARPRAS
jgi:hypothetical protein